MIGNCSYVVGRQQEFLKKILASLLAGADFVMATRKMHALVQVHLTSANQSKIRKAYFVSDVVTTNLEDKQRFREAVSCFDRFPAKTTRYIKCKFNI